ncbi:MAG: ATP-binding protein [Desulfomonilaceae bacterium]|nr:ATP-binding protein [Desulfomonilaceae bacterium]
MELQTGVKRPDKESQNNGYYRSLTRKMVASILLVSITPLILISMAILYYFEASYKEKVEDYLKVLVKKHRGQIDGFLEQRLADIMVLTTSYTMEQLGDGEFLEKQLAKLHDAYTHAFVDLGVVNDQGVQLAYAGPFKLREADYSKAPWFKEAIKTDYYISNVFTGLRGLPHFIVSVRRETKGHSWILRATVNFEAFNSLVQSIRIGETGCAYILNTRGDFQTEPACPIAPSSGPLKDFVQAAEMLTTRVHIIERKDDFGTELLYVMAGLKGGNWLLVYQQSAADAFSVIYQARTIATVIFGVALTSIVAVTFLISRNMVRRIALADRQKELMNDQVIHAGKLASIGELAAGIAHEINNPLAIMMEEAGWMEDLLEDEEAKGLPPLDELTRSIEQIKKQGRRCKETTQKLLSFARRTDLEAETVHLNDIVEEVVNLSQQRAKYDNVTIVPNLSQNLPPVTLSPSEMEQVLLNLISNSLDAMKPNGGIIDIWTYCDEDHVLLDVEDNGPGIPEANLPRIFDPFFTTKPVGQGTGLGLSICYGIIKKLGGDITVSSTVGKGTAFHIRIPKAQE